MLGGRQLADKRRAECEKIIGQPVAAVFMNGNLPHGVGLAWVGKNSAYLVNFRKRHAKRYVADGKFILRRIGGLVQVRPKMQRSFFDTDAGLQAYLYEGMT